jgi:hypothetical protein
LTKTVEGIKKSVAVSTIISMLMINYIHVGGEGRFILYAMEEWKVDQNIGNGRDEINGKNYEKYLCGKLVYSRRQNR